ncbi:MAG TPA: hypothetical protein VFS12_02680, partial [Terriglobia bacterium]|nr:hypothetical protein [Terriglobia bacterium]
PFFEGEYYGALPAIVSSVRRWLLVPLIVAVSWVLFALPMLQTASDIDIATLLPPGAMIYLESQDFLGQLQRWSDSGVKQRWLASANFSEFEKSRLYLRLKDRLQEFNSLAGLSTDLPLVRSLAGKQAGLGLYSVRDLEFVFATKIPSGSFEQGPFFQQRTRYEQRSAEGGAYFARSGPNGAIAFAIRGGYFFLATRESLLRTVLHNFSVAASRERLNAEPLFQESQTALARSGDVWMYLNMGLVQDSRYFRNEWLYKNLEETARYRAGVVRLAMQSGQYREERQFLLEEGAAGPAAIDPALLQGLPDNLELVRAEAATPKVVALVLHETLLNLLRRRDQTLSLTRREDPYETAPLLKTDNRYFLQIDEPAPAAENLKESQQREMQQMLSELEAELQTLGSTALVQCRSTQLDAGGYVRTQHGFVLKGGANLDRLKQVIQRQYNWLYHGGRPASWTREGSTEVLGSLSQVALETKGSLFAVGNSATFVRSLLNSAASARDSSRAVHYYARLDLRHLRPHYEALFQWLDYEAVPSHPGAPPPYFSANLGGLLGALQPVETLVVQRWVGNRTLHEEVVYRGEL